MSDPTTHSMPDPRSLKLVLGSTSPFRRQLLERLGVAFEIAAPEVDESCLPRERPRDLVRRLALAKAQAVAASHPHSLVIGSDQVACIDGTILGKPGTHDRARRQLQRASGKRVSFFTGLCLLNTDSGNFHLVCEPFNVHFRRLRPEQIERYLTREKPYNCAGSFKSEGLGIALFERLEGDDPNALVGLPMIRLISMLAAEGIEIP